MITRPKLKPGEEAPDFTLPATDGSTVTLSDYVPLFSATTVMFICNHCPYVQAYIPRLIELQRELLGPESANHAGGVAGGAKGAVVTPASAVGRVRFLGICSNDAATHPDDSFENMKEMAREWGLNFPYLRDEDQSVAHAYGAERTPEIFVLDQKGTCCYEGGIDDNYQDEAKVTQRPLRDALLALVSGEPIRQPRTHAIGCTIKWKKG